MSSSRAINSIEADQALRLIREGKTWSEIAAMVGRSASGLQRALTETWPDELAEAKQAREDIVRNRVWTLGMQNTDPATARWALDHLIKWHLPEGRETHRVELSTPEPIRIEGGKRPVGIADVFTLAQELGVGLGAGIRTGATRPTLPAAEDVRAGGSDGPAELPAGPVASD